MKSSDDTSTALGPPLIGALLRAPWEIVNARMLAGLRERGFEGLTAPHLAVLRYPGPEGMRPSDLAARARMSKQALNYLLGQMEGLGYLTREQDGEDRRGKRVRLTPRGWDAGRAMREIVREVEAEWERKLGPERFGQLRELLAALGDARPGPVPAAD